jgi:hypothetical protein
MKNSHVANVSPVEERLMSRPYDRRENFDSVPPQEIPKDGLVLDFVTIRYGSTNANRMKIDLCEYADYSGVVDKNVLQSAALHDTLDVRVDLTYPCKNVFFTIFAYPRFTVETTLQFHGSDDAVLKEHIFLKDMENVSFLFSYDGAEPATYFTITGGANLFIDNIVCMDTLPSPELLLRNGGFEDGSEFWTLSYNAGVHPVAGGHHLVLGGTHDNASYAEQRLDRTKSAAGSHVLSFTIGPVFPVAPDAEEGEVSLIGSSAGNRFGFTVEGDGRRTMTFVFDVSEEDATRDLTLRIAKLKGGAGIQGWFVDDVKLQRTPARTG